MKRFSGFSKIESSLLGVCIAGSALCSIAFFMEDAARVEHHPRPIARAQKAVSVPQPNADSAPVLHVANLKEMISDGGSPVTVSHVLRWRGQSPKGFSVQISNTKDFAGDTLYLHSAGTSLAITRAFPGENFWRVSADGKRWSEEARFPVRVLPVEDLIENLAARMTAEAGPAAPLLKFGWRGPRSIQRVVVEVSNSREFENERTELILSKNLDYAARFEEPGTFYVRARGVNAEGRLTEASAVTEVHVRTAGSKN